MFGMVATLFEWTATWLTLWPEDGLMKKDDIKGIIDVSVPAVVLSSLFATILMSCCSL